MGRQRVQAVPNMMIGYDSLKLLKYLDDSTRLLVFDSVVNYFSKARCKGASDVSPTKIENNAMANEIMSDMISDIDSGIESYWRIAERNSNVRKSAPVVTSGDQSSPVVTNIEYSNKENIEIKDSYINYIHSPIIEQIMQSENKGVFIKIINEVKDAGFSLSDSFYEGIARKIKFDLMDEASVKSVIEVCKRDGILDEDYFFKIFNNKLRYYKI